MSLVFITPLVHAQRVIVLSLIVTIIVLLSATALFSSVELKKKKEASSVSGWTCWSNKKCGLFVV